MSASRLRRAVGALVATWAGATGVAWSAGESASGELAFVSIRSGDPQIYLRDSRGQIRPVTEGKGLPGQPAWAANGQLAYAARVGQAPRIFVTDENGAAPRRLTADERMETSASWSPDGKAIAYYSRALDGTATELRLVEVASGKSTTLMRDPRDMGPTPPSWSADGSRLAFSVVFDHEHSHIWVVQRDGSALRNISEKHAKRGAAWPQISPDGTQVLWIAEMRDRMPIIVTDVASGESRELTPDKRAAAESPRWSPDGRQIVFASMFGSAAQGRNDIFVMDADGSNVRNLSRNGGENFDPKWAADGRSVVFASLRSGTSLLYEVSLFDGTTQPVSVHASHDMDHFVRPVASR